MLATAKMVSVVSWVSSLNKNVHLVGAPGISPKLIVSFGPDPDLTQSADSVGRWLLTQFYGYARFDRAGAALGARHL